MLPFLFSLSCTGPEPTPTEQNTGVEEVYPATDNHRAKGRHILIAYEKAWRAAPEIRRSKEDAFQRAETVRTEVLKGISFASLAKQYSDDPTKHHNTHTI